jgi:hypothetical protein
MEMFIDDGYQSEYDNENLLSYNTSSLGYYDKSEKYRDRTRKVMKSLNKIASDKGKFHFSGEKRMIALIDKAISLTEIFLEYLKTLTFNFSFITDPFFLRVYEDLGKIKRNRNAYSIDYFGFYDYSEFMEIFIILRTNIYRIGVISRGFTTEHFLYRPL